MLGSGLNLVTTVIGFGMSATFIIFICARLICGRIRSGDSRAANSDIELHSDLDPREHTIHGLEPVEVAAIPTVKFNHEAFKSREDAQCSICLADYEEKEILRVMPTCNHNFHVACIDVWLQKQSTCPICRLPLSDMFEVPPEFEVLHEQNNTEHTDEHSNQWLLPSHRRSEGIESNQETRDSVSINIGG
ncbi:uncharacterized protein A4U43_C10F11870 [Asparagus officinalis]|uniref:RING-type domain-containing protein n=1 Tax=Asparagus officinalis TaxID=4686 RepID=A0A5P1E271_ASPOF|nr:putative RING-H2 finger protein ATL69 [Asparagus officinalis]ONK56704.1 uncharacterized protein A4U43_C10F11870 [Asparagus officinalis]